jgi:hypothetical protein
MHAAFQKIVILMEGAKVSEIPIDISNMRQFMKYNHFKQFAHSVIIVATYLSELSAFSQFVPWRLAQISDFNSFI